MSLRKLYYLLPPGSRLLLRKMIYWPEDHWNTLLNKNEELLPPKRLIYTGRGNFIQTGLKFFELFKAEARLKPQSKILDIGSGIGRMAIPLVDFLNEDGKYLGFDIVQQGITWCKENIQKRYPNFNFIFVELQNQLYQSKGRQAEDFVFPADDNSFDLALAISVFTHLEFSVVQQYLSQTNRVLKIGGYGVATFFLIDEDVRNDQFSTAHFNFKHKESSQYMIDQRVRTANVAFDQSMIIQEFNQGGFKIQKIIKGSWRNVSDNENPFFQDVIIYSKRKELD